VEPFLTVRPPDRDEIGIPRDQFEARIQTRCGLGVSYVRVVKQSLLKGDVMVSFKSVLVAAAGAASLGLAGVAGAQTSAQAPQLVVHYSPATLNTDTGVRQLYGRLLSAAQKVCVEPQVGPFPSSAELACRKQAVSEAVAQIHNSRLAELSSRYTKIG
jgi:UrcA family protein